MIAAYIFYNIQLNIQPFKVNTAEVVRLPAYFLN